MGLSRDKGSYHERWWVKFFQAKGCEAKRQPLSGAMGGEFSSDIKIETRLGGLVAESKYQSNGRGFSFLTKTHLKQPADLYLYKQRSGPKFIVMEADSLLAEKFMVWLSGEDT